MNSSSTPNSGLGFLRLAADAVKAEQLEEALARYEYHAKKAHSFLLDAFALDTPAVDRLHPHLRKVNVPRLKPDTTNSRAFSTTEVALLAAKPRATPEDDDARELERRTFDKHHPDYVPLTDEQKARRYNAGGYVDMPRELARQYGISAREVEHFTDLARAPEPTFVSSLPRAALDKAAGRTRAEGAPLPWKDTK